MSEITPDDQTPDGVRNLRTALDREKQRAEANEAAARELAMLKAGVDVTNPVAELFISSYTGEMTPDAIKEAASKYGLVSEGTPPAPPAGEQPPANQPPADPGDQLEGLLQQQQQIAGAVPPEQLPPTDKLDEFYEDFRKERQSGMDEEAARSNFFHRVFAEAYAGKNPQFLAGPDGRPLNQQV